MSADIHGLVGAYAVDAVDEQERRAFELHLAECPECRAEVDGLREAAAQLALTSQTPPPAAMRDAVLAGIRAVRPLPPLETRGPATAGPADEPSDGPSAGRADEPADEQTPGRGEPVPTETTVVPLRSRRRVTAWLATAAAAASVLVGGLVWSPWDNGPTGVVSPAEQVLAAKDAQRFEKVIDGARATIVRSASLGKAVIVADNMPAAPDGKDFQLWLDQPGRGMVSAGLMPHGSSPTVTMVLQGDAATATGAGITLEPAGGSVAPTTAPIALFPFS